MKDMSDQEIAEKVVKGIVEDLRDRRGLKGEWNAIDKDIQQEIRDAWAKIVIAGLKLRE